MNVRDIDELLGIPARLAIVASLADGQSRTFSDLKRETGLADGNLHVQCRKLSTAGYLVAEKRKQGNRRVTCFQLTDTGRENLQAHVQGLNAVVKPSGRSGLDRSGRTPKDDAMVW